MASAPLISVVVTCYNLAPYIGAALDSAISQQCAVPFEVIVVDDCSTDGSDRIIKRHAGARYIRTASNNGVLAATLAGIGAARGQIVAFLDGDDLWRPGKLAAVHGAFAADPSIALLTHDLEFIDQAGAHIDRPSRPAHVLTPLQPDLRSDAVREGILAHSDYVWLGSALVVDRANGLLDEFVEWAQGIQDLRNTYQDWPLAYWIAANPQARLHYLPDKFLAYRLHGANSSGGAQPPERLAHNFRRNRNTLEAMRAIALMREMPSRYVAALSREIASADYLAALHEGGGIGLTGQFLRSLPDFHHRGLVLKELVRFVGIVTLGAERFVQMANRRRHLRHLRPS